MVWLSLYLLGKYRAFHPVQTVGFTGAVLLSSPIAVAFFVAVSRVRDYKHNFSDINAGSLLGVLVAYFVYYLYYPPLSSRRSHLPKDYVEEKPDYEDDETVTGGPSTENLLDANPSKVEVSAQIV